MRGLWNLLNRCEVVWGLVFAGLMFLAAAASFVFDGGKQADGVAIPEALVEVDEAGWAKTLHTIEEAYGAACNEGLLRYYKGNRADGVKGYTCTPVRGAVHISKDGKPLGAVEVTLPWERRRNAFNPRVRVANH